MSILSFGAIPSYVLVHTGIPLHYEEPQTTVPEWIEGEPGSAGGGEPIEDPPFACVLFLPSAGGEGNDQYRARVVESPTLLWNPYRVDGSLVQLGVEDEVLVTAAELAPWTGGVQVRWQVVGEPMAAGRPGSIAVVQAQLRQVRG